MFATKAQMTSKLREGFMIRQSAVFWLFFIRDWKKNEAKGQCRGEL